MDVQSIGTKTLLLVCRVSTRQAVLFPDLHEPLPFTIIVAKQVQVVILPQPAMDLREKLFSLGLRNLWFGRTVAQGTECLEVLQIPQNRLCCLPIGFKLF